MDEVLAVDSIAQRLWIGAWNHIYCYNLKDERFVTISDSTFYQTVRMDTAPGGGVMAYKQHGLYRIIIDDSLTKGRAEQINFSVYGKPEPLTLDRINALTGLGMTTPSHIPYFIYAILVVLVFAAAITVLRRRKRRAESAMTDSDVTVGEGNSKPLPHPGQVPGYDFAERAAVLLNRHIADKDFNIT